MRLSASFIVLFLVVLNIHGQKPEIQRSIITRAATNDTAFSFYMYEEEANRLLYEFIEASGKKRGKKTIHRFRGQYIPGINEKLTVMIYEGVDTNEDVTFSYFNTYRNEDDRINQKSNLKPNQREGIIVYIKGNNRLKNEWAINSNEESNIVTAHFGEIIYP